MEAARPETPRPEARAATRAPDLPRAEAAVRELLSALGVDVDDPQLATTPRTVARAFSEVLLSGYHTSTGAALGRGFPVVNDGPLVATRIPLMFVCPHHLMPAHGEVHVALSPRGRVPGLARIAKLADTLAHRLVLQEDLALGIVRALEEHFDVAAAVAIVDASHTCVAVEDYARRGTTFRTRASVGPAALTASLEREIDVTLSASWPTSSSTPPSGPRSSRSGSRSPRTCAETPSAPTSSPPPRRSRSGG
ncbi:GTP cyclohydrolase I, partial [Myxococcota bacterium]|nr:GTP cyclohydrolase I [Myxococcota bacterium]